MFQMILYTQWKWSRLLVVTCVVVAFALPLLTVQKAGIDPANAWTSLEALATAEQWGVWYVVFAVTCGMLTASYAWLQDHRTGHVHALTLPVPRWYYALLRYGAGATLLVAPVVALWVSGQIAAWVAVIPEGVHAYPTALAIRFAVGTLLAYSVFFAISAGTSRIAGYVLAVIGAVLVVQILFGAAGTDVNLLEKVFDRIVIWPGPFEIFTGRWVLLDV